MPDESSPPTSDSHDDAADSPSESGETDDLPAGSSDWDVYDDVRDSLNDDEAPAPVTPRKVEDPPDEAVSNIETNPYAWGLIGSTEETAKEIKDYTEKEFTPPNPAPDSAKHTERPAEATEKISSSGSPEPSRSSGSRRGRRRRRRRKSPAESKQQVPTDTPPAATPTPTRRGGRPRKRRRRRGRLPEAQSAALDSLRTRVQDLTSAVAGSSVRTPGESLNKSLSALRDVAARSGAEAEQTRERLTADLESRIRSAEAHLIPNDAFFDLFTPGLDAIDGPRQAGDLHAALDGLHVHFKEKKFPEEIMDLLSPDGPEDAARHADLICLHFHKYQAHPPIHIGSEIDWDLNPVADIEWPVHLNRHGDWAILGTAYEQTKRERYAQKYVEQLGDWLLKNPVARPIPGKIAWRTLDAAIRTQTWVSAFLKMRTSREFVPLPTRMLLSGVHAHGEYLMNFHAAGGNWLLYEAAGLIRLAATFPEFARARDWMAEGARRLQEQISVQVLDDGAHLELCPDYHQGAINSFYIPARLARLTGRGELFSDDYFKRIESMYEWTLALIKPDGTMPRLGDARRISALGALRQGAARFERPEFAAAAQSPDDTRGDAPARTDFALDPSGHYVMRSSWSTGADYLLFDAAPHGGWHSDHDLFQIIVSTAGRSILVDPSVMSYAEPIHSDWGRTHRHNTICVDGRNQEPSRGENVRFESSDSLTLVRATHSAYEGVRHTRKILYVDRRWWLVLDVMDSDEVHEYQQSWQFEPESVLADPTRKSLEADGLLMVPVPPCAANLELADGQIVHTYAEALDRPVAKYRVGDAKKCVFAMVLFPLRDVSASGVSVEGAESDGATIATVRYGDNADIVAIAHASGATLEVTGQSLEGEAAAWQKLNDGATDLLGQFASE